MRRLRRGGGLVALAVTLGAVAALPVAAATTPRVLVFSGTYGFRHQIITESNGWIQEWGASSGAYEVDVTENPLDLTAANLADYDALYFNNIAGKTPLTDQQRDEVIRFVACGGGWVGNHMSGDSNHAWPEYLEITSANIVEHPLTENHEPATTFVIEDPSHPIIADSFDGGEDMTTTDELYTWRRDPRRLPTVHPLLSLDVSTISDEIQEDPNRYYVDGHPAAWTSIFRGGGRVFYNSFGHGNLSWDNQWFQDMMHNGLLWVLGDSGHPVDRDCAAGSDPLPPPNGPREPDGSTPVEACEMPTWGHYVSTVSRLTEDGGDVVMPVALPAYLFAPNLRFVLDLSQSGAHTADLDISLTWIGASDFDLGVTLPWGFAGSGGAMDNPAAGEHVELLAVPHCTDFLVAAEHLYSSEGVIQQAGVPAVEQARPTLTIAVTPNPDGPTKVAEKPTAGDAADAQEIDDLPASGGGVAAALALLLLAAARSRRSAADVDRRTGLG